jgi:hypothetical protein
MASRQRAYAIAAFCTLGLWVTVLMAATGAHATEPTVSRWEYRHVAPYDSRDRVQHVFDTRGHRVVAWAGPTGWMHLWKNYPADDGSWVQVRYSHRPGPFVWRVARHAGLGWCPTYSERCANEGKS